MLEHGRIVAWRLVVDEQDVAQADVRLVALDDSGKVAVLAHDVERAREVVARLGVTLQPTTV
ncbi:MAG: hypothetical protein NVV70_12320 [Cellulomonas sp.]|uniref:hypothetical protein n=1 Tax=Cellulomonas sp. A375-1 TaxID=1672219 RepID=UPI00065271B4|nr:MULTISPECIES: hypothetical protein [unclassified Cellulomonas]KMM45041.1 hypothetical protein CWIS_12885 [Cellulomonas sp. A375-1]MCR6648872.1 hypothetical protein [Cellulomonas sp.]